MFLLQPSHEACRSNLMSTPFTAGSLIPQNQLMPPAYSLPSWATALPVQHPASDPPAHDTIPHRPTMLEPSNAMTAMPRPSITSHAVISTHDHHDHQHNHPPPDHMNEQYIVNNNKTNHDNHAIVNIYRLYNKQLMNIQQHKNMHHHDINQLINHYQPNSSSKFIINLPCFPLLQLAQQQLRASSLRLRGLLPQLRRGPPRHVAETARGRHEAHEDLDRGSNQQLRSVGSPQKIQQWPMRCQQGGLRIEGIS